MLSQAIDSLETIRDLISLASIFAAEKHFKALRN